jgi:polyisoprenoid-binding protein YceI
VETDGDDFTTASTILFTASIDSIDTNNAQRDTHLKSADFFDVANHPDIKFIGKNFTAHEDHYDLYGDLTIRGITKPITLHVEFGGLVTDPYGQTKAGFTVEGKIKRKEFNLHWDAMTEAGQVVVSNEIRIHCEVQLIKQDILTVAQEKATEKAVEA